MRAVDAAVEGMNFTRVMGQSCGSTSRVFVPESLREDFVALLVERVSGLSFGDPTLEATDLGPLVSRAHRDRVSAHVDQAIADGVRVLLGGQLPGPPFDRGFYYPPTILEVEDPSKAIANDEVFGPVLAVIPWTDEEQMLTAVNNVRYGLTASIFTENLNGALHMASRIRCGYVWVNDVERRWLGIPFGGVKDSGTTTEYSVDELLQFTQNKTVSIALT
jgi:aldehyde dehydrogenase (NAD+)/betaine-aldehyde dehydrogenase